MTFSRIEDAIAAVARGEMIIVVDDENRENEGDIVVAADAVTSETIAFMMKHARGLVCMSLPGERLDELAIPPMVGRNSESMQTAFTVSVDLMHGISTGISAGDRAKTVRALIDPTSQPGDFARPGHIFPLRAKPWGVLDRPGHTEAAVDIARLAGRAASGVICEIANDDGTMARLPQLEAFAKTHGLHLITIEALIAYRRRTEGFVVRNSSSKMPTQFGEFIATSYTCTFTGTEHLALTLGELGGKDRVTARVHSECLTGESFGSLRCDCGQQLDRALQAIQQAGSGCLIYLRGQEGRGIGLSNKISAYALQDAGLDTVQANQSLGFPDDTRDYLAAASILKDLGVGSVSLLTNNPAKIAGLEECGIVVAERRSLIVASQAENVSYLRTKREKSGHFLEAV